ncbi:MAG TPA: glycosyltransferase family 4 protein [Methylococcaceae bacterium]|nr:glycosyltransferase family 4 protein [Methylococcaceae bacterium]
MKKLIFVNRYFYPDHSATSQMLSDLAFGLAKKGDCEIHVVTSRQRYDNPMAGLSPRETVDGVEIHRTWTSTFGRNNLIGRAFDYLGFYLTAFGKLLVLADRHTVIVAKTDPPLISVVAAVAARIKSATLINWVQDLFPEVAAALGVPLAKGPLFGLLRGLRNFSLKAARINVAIGDLMRQRLRDEGIPADRIRVVHNWADGEQIRPILPEANPLRKEWGLDGKFVVGYSGNLGRSHEFGTILEAAAALRGRLDIVFLMIGGGANLPGVQKEVAAKGLRNIVFKPYQPRERLAESLSASDAHLVSLRPELEGLIVPSKFYGIAAAGRPVLFIGSPKGEIAGIVAKSFCGYSVALGDGAGLKEKISQMADHPELRHAMGHAALSEFRALFSFPAALTHWETVLAS